ncbi:MAG: F0F1 ATP synthase subunit epsilon [Gemmatimonadetes bacterium]|nr:F0F1 ATP synthase subunit epsilon [Gemmatimonadota bacterium]MBI2537142.1 F0F1 ATP synthase subunit epsilon [Gemmatimonadota bacterium]MBI2616315.1 F0F1 ATP synthase subunit epsilon [Gemmatimonadota bacterium]
MRVTLISPDRSVYDGEATSVIAPAYDGEVGILPHHAPFMTLLGDGRLVVRTGGGVQQFQVRGGFLQVRDDVVRLVTEHAEEDTHAS